MAPRALGRHRPARHQQSTRQGIMKILVIGSGGREHALAWKLSRSARVPQSARRTGQSRHGTRAGRRECPRDGYRRARRAGANEAVGLTVVGPEAPSPRAWSTRSAQPDCRSSDHPGPPHSSNPQGLRQTVFVRHGIPTAKYQTFADAASAHAYLDAEGAPIVIKADGLAAGKGVVVAMSLEQAHQAVDMMLVDNRMGGAGARVVIEEFMQGGSQLHRHGRRSQCARPRHLQDHKRLEDGDQGPNTGGMGAYRRPRWSRPRSMRGSCAK